MSKSIYLLFAILLLALTACKDQEASKPAEAPKQAEAKAPAAASPAASEDKESLPTIVAFGDSLTAGYGLAPQETYAYLLQKRLDADGYQYKVVNAGVSGDTSAGGLKRIDASLQSDVRVVILELGSNDIYRNLPLDDMKNNLGQIIERAQSRGAQVLLAGIEAPNQLDAALRKEIRDLFSSLAQTHKVAFIPSILDKVAGVDSLNQADGVHPNAKGSQIVAERIYDHLRPLLERERARQPNKPLARSR